jgi:hypothetical protein
VTVTTPPRRPEIEQDRDLQQRVADLEALIEEARRRARRRRQRNWAAALLIAAAGAAVLIGFGGHGGGGSTAALADGSGGGSKARTASPAPPRCSAADTRRTATLLVDGGVHNSPLYIRSCGPAQAVIDLNGQSYPIRGGYCRPASVRGTELVSIGLLANAPAAPGRGIALTLPTRSGPTRINDSEFEVPGRRVEASGTVILGKGLKGGTFTLYGRTASGPTGVRLSGSWACG